MNGAPTEPSRSAARGLPRLMLVTDRKRTGGHDLVRVVSEAAAGGLRLILLRESDLSDPELSDLARRILEQGSPATRLIVNGRPDLAQAMGWGLHMPARAPALTRRPGAPYGRSIHDEHELRFAVEDGADYGLLGTIYPTESKPGRRGAGIALVERIRRQGCPLPLYAIGGVTVARIPALIHAGAYGVAVTGAILGARDPRRVVEAMLLALGLGAEADDVS